MTPTITYLAAQAHRDDLLRNTRRHRGYGDRGFEGHVRQMLRRAPPRQATRRTRPVPVAAHR